MLTALPVTKFALSDTINVTRSATSSGVPVRPSGLAREKPRGRGGAIHLAFAHFLVDQRRRGAPTSIYCGHTALTRILSRATASATDLVSAIQAALVTPDGNRSGCG